MGVGGQLQAPADSGMTRDPLYRMLGGSQGRSERVPKMSHPPRFDPGTVQPLYRLSYPKGKILTEAITDCEGHHKNFYKRTVEEDKRNTKQAVDYKSRDVKICCV
jgi:hypothetical protein